jgi:hypothetical protein
MFRLKVIELIVENVNSNNNSDLLYIILGIYSK